MVEKKVYEAVPLPTSLEQANLVGFFNGYKNRIEQWLRNYIEKVVYELIDGRIKSLTQEEYLTINEACSFLKISKPTLHRWSESGKVKKRDLFGNPRYLKSELVSLIK